MRTKKGRAATAVAGASPCSGCGKKPIIWYCRTSRPGWWAVQCTTGCRDDLEPMARSEAMAVKGWNAIQASIQNDEALRRADKGA